jgi:hypothetical protein
MNVAIDQASAEEQRPEHQPNPSGDADDDPAREFGKEADPRRHGRLPAEELSRSLLISDLLIPREHT